MSIFGKLVKGLLGDKATTEEKPELKQESEPEREPVVGDVVVESDVNDVTIVGVEKTEEPSTGEKLLEALQNEQELELEPEPEPEAKKPARKKRTAKKKAAKKKPAAEINPKTRAAEEDAFLDEYDDRQAEIADKEFEKLVREPARKRKKPSASKPKERDGDLNLSSANEEEDVNPFKPSPVQNEALRQSPDKQKKTPLATPWLTALADDKELKHQWRLVAVALMPEHYVFYQDVKGPKGSEGKIERAPFGIHQKTYSFCEAAQILQGHIRMARPDVKDIKDIITKGDYSNLEKDVVRLSDVVSQPAPEAAA